MSRSLNDSRKAKVFFHFALFVLFFVANLLLSNSCWCGVPKSALKRGRDTAVL